MRYFHISSGQCSLLSLPLLFKNEILWKGFQTVNHSFPTHGRIVHHIAIFWTSIYFVCFSTTICNWLWLNHLHFISKSLFVTLSIVHAANRNFGLTQEELKLIEFALSATSAHHQPIIYFKKSTII